MKNSSISWTDHTFSPWHGCQKVSAGCTHCYAESLDKRFGPSHWGPNSERRFLSENYWKQPLAWNDWAMRGVCLKCMGTGRIRIQKTVIENSEPVEAVERIECEECSGYGKVEPYRARVFCASMADVFEDRPDLIATRGRLFNLIRQTPWLDWLLLTKRPENILPLIHAAFIDARENPFGCFCTDLAGHLEQWIDGAPWPNVWLGTSVENQEAADKRIPELLKVPAVVRFLSCEPLLGPVNISRYMWPVCGWWRGNYRSYEEAKAAGGECGLKRQALVSAHARFVNWVIAGGESGPGARPMKVSWARSLKEQCEAANVTFFMKQMGAVVDGVGETLGDWPNGANWDAKRQISRLSLQDKKGGDSSEWPLDLRVQEFPQVPA